MNDACEPAEKITFQDLWDACDRERAGAQAWSDMQASKGNAEIAAPLKRRAAIFLKLQVLVGRISDSPMIKAELKEISIRERIAADVEKDADGEDEGSHVAD